MRTDRAIFISDLLPQLENRSQTGSRQTPDSLIAWLSEIMGLWSRLLTRLGGQALRAGLTSAANAFSGGVVYAATAQSRKEFVSILVAAHADDSNACGFVFKFTPRPELLSRSRF